MEQKTALHALKSFADVNQGLLGSIAITPHEKAIDACKFHVEYKELSQNLGDAEGRVSGLYLYYSKQDEIVLYIGIAKDIYTRFLDHIGKGFSFGEDCSFPNFDLIEKYKGWCSNEAQRILTSGDFMVHAIRVEPFNAASLLESFLIYYGDSKGCKPELNVSF